MSAKRGWRRFFYPETAVSSSSQLPPFPYIVSNIRQTANTTSSVVHSYHHVIESMVLVNKCVYGKLVEYVKEDLPPRTITPPQSLSVYDETAAQSFLRKELIDKWWDDIPFRLKGYYVDEAS
ncbi:MAG: hypothetical protein M1830_005103, partial [Pleopsidium flavum]